MTTVGYPQTSHPLDPVLVSIVPGSDKQIPAFLPVSCSQTFLITAKKSSFVRYKKDSFYWYKRVIASNGKDLD